MSAHFINSIPLILLTILAVLIQTKRVRFGMGLGDIIMHSVIYLSLVIYLFFIAKIYFFKSLATNHILIPSGFLILGLYLMLKMTYWRGVSYKWDGYILIPRAKDEKNQIATAFNNAKIINGQLYLPRTIKKRLKLLHPFYSIPKLDAYNEEIKTFSRRNNTLPFFQKEDINNDGKEEIILILKSFFNGFGQLVIISFDDFKLKFTTIKWKRPVNALFFDYLITTSSTKKYRAFGLQNFTSNKKTTDIEPPCPHVITRGYLSRIVYWTGTKYEQSRFSRLNNPSST